VIGTQEQRSKCGRRDHESDHARTDVASAVATWENDQLPAHATHVTPRLCAVCSPS